MTCCVLIAGSIGVLLGLKLRFLRRNGRGGEAQSWRLPARLGDDAD